MTKYLVQFTKYKDDTLYYKVITGEANATWNDLQRISDPFYLHGNFRFFPMGNEIKMIEQ